MATENHTSKTDPVSDEVVERVREVIYLGQGLDKPQTRVQLQILAKKYGLSGEALQEAIRRATTRPKAPDTPEAQAYRADAVKFLKTHTVLTPPLKRQLLERAQSKHHLTEADATAILDDVLRDADGTVQVLTEEGVRAHVLEHVRDLAQKHSGRKLKLSLEKYYANAKSLGMSKDGYHEVFHQVRQEAGREVEAEQRQERLRRGVIVGGCVAVAVAVMLALGFCTYWAETSGRPDGAGPEANVAPTPAPPPAPRWGEPDRTLALNALRQRFPTESAVLAQLDSLTEADRAAGYQQLLARPAAFGAKDHAALGDLLVCAYAAEPNDANAGHIREGLVRLLPGKAPPAVDAEAYERAFWALQVALRASQSPALGTGRADQLGRALEDCGLALDRSKKQEELTKRAGALLCRQLYFALMAGVGAAKAEDLVRVHGVLGKRAGDFLPTEELELLDTRFLVGALTAVGAAWRPFEPLLQRCCRGQDPDNLRALVRLADGAIDAGLRKELEIVLKPLRAKLGEGAAPVGPDRGTRFREVAQKALAGVLSPPERTEVILRETVELAHASTLGCALDQKQLGFAKFDELSTRGVPQRKKAASNPPAGSAPAAPGQPGGPLMGKGRFRPGLGRMPFGGFGGRSNDPAEVKRAIDALSNANFLVREAGLTILAEAARDGQDWEPGQARELARYLLTTTTRGRGELDLLRSHAGDFARHREVQLALLDVLERVPLAAYPIPRSIMERLLSDLGGQTVKLAGDAEWPRKAQQLLLQIVIKGLGDDEENDADRCADALRDLYKEQGFLLGMGPEDFVLVSGPGQALEVLASGLATRLEKADLDPATRKEVVRLRQELRAGVFLALNDVQRAVASQRAWVPLLALHVARQAPARADRARKLSAELRQEKTTHVLQQLRSGEEKALKLWLLVHEQK